MATAWTQRPNEDRPDKAGPTGPFNFGASLAINQAIRYGTYTCNRRLCVQFRNRTVLADSLAAHNPLGPARGMAMSGIGPASGPGTVMAHIDVAERRDHFESEQGSPKSTGGWNCFGPYPGLDYRAACPPVNRKFNF
jgi:hypothetical protein